MRRLCHGGQQLARDLLAGSGQPPSYVDAMNAKDFARVASLFAADRRVDDVADVGDRVQVVRGFTGRCRSATGWGFGGRCPVASGRSARPRSSRLRQFEYGLTPLGEGLRDVLEAMATWAKAVPDPGADVTV
ncbi:hypothetical protein [Micromonospora sp. CPCC 206061]|uniref:hypothetical protein n=1 Tax=Micromonospora sp. CPCC 206061 TaxID=3122410 RepID=UPI002FF2C363